MSKTEPNVQKLDVHPLDNFREAFMRGLYRLKIRRRSLRFDFWRGSFAADETLTTMEPADDRH